MTAREMSIKVAWRWLGLPYRWGGDDPMSGFDCSGFVVEVLKSVGALPRKGDWTAAGLWERFQGARTVEPGAGCLVFYWGGSPRHIVHVEFLLDKVHTIGASGGGAHIMTVADAMAGNAYIKVRPLPGRKSVAGFVDPFAD